MEHFVVSARKYRPKTFQDVVGQLAITNTLQNAIENDHLAQALLFCGPRGVGKTSCARILAKQINQQIHHDENEDFAFNIFELDAASNNSVDDIRSLIEQVRIPPQVGNYKVYIIDEVHMLSSAAFNAFLKTLEEPPKHAIFILATTEKHKIIPTILSRCQIFDFKRITVKDAAKYLAHIAKEQGIEAEDDALHIIAQKADGAMRDALSIFDRVVSFSGKKLTRKAVTENLNVLDYDTYFSSTKLILENKIPDLLLLFNECLAKGFDGHHFISGLASHFRDLLVCKNEATLELLEVGDTAKAQYKEQAKIASIAFLLQGIDKANDCDLKYKTSKNQRLLVELTIMQLASITFDGEKKKSKNYIIPATFFISTTQKNVAITKPIPKKEISENVIDSSIAKPNLEVTQNIVPPVKDIPKPKLNIGGNRKSSGLSLSSIQRRKDHLDAKQAEEVVHVVLPTEEFQADDLLEIWSKYTEEIRKTGEHNLASILEIDRPKVTGSKVRLTLPNKSMKIQLERAQGPLLGIIRKKLNNYDIHIEIDVNEMVEKKYVYTDIDILNKLIEENPSLSLLQQEFGLDLM